MIITNGPLVIVVGAVVALAAGGIGYYFSHDNLLIALAAWAVPLFLFSVFANFVYGRMRPRSAAPPDAVAPPSRRGLLRSALFYFTVGTLLVIWSGLWYWYLSKHPPGAAYVWYICEGLILTGILLVAVGGLVFQLRQGVSPRPPVAAPRGPVSASSS